MAILRGLAFSATGILKVSTPAVVVGADPLGVEGVGEHHLAGEHAERTLGQFPFHALALTAGTALGLHGEHVPLHVDVDRLRVHPGQIEADHVLVAGAVGVQRHRGRTRPGTGRAQELLGQTVQLTERVGAHQHGKHLQVVGLR